MEKPYIPSQKNLDNYAKVLVNFALNNGKGIKKGEVVMVQAKEATRPLFDAVCKQVWRSGGYVIPRYMPNNWERRGHSADFYELASAEQLDFFEHTFYKGLVDQIDHQIAILGEADPHYLKHIDPKKIMRYERTLRPFFDMRGEKENRGKFSWTLALYGTPAQAKEAGMSQKEYWGQIIKACFLDKKDPIKEWQRVFRLTQGFVKKLNSLEIDKVHVEGPDIDLWVTIGEKRAWAGASGANIPSFEIYTSPDWRGTEGRIRFNQPLYRYGNLVEGIELEFKGGRVVRAKAKKNEKFLKAMIAAENADKVGEFSLTDRRFSRITRFMAETLYDENIGGPNGNTHIAVGNAYHNCYQGDPGKVSTKEWERLGYNHSSVHTDMFSTTPRTVTAYLKNGKSRVIYKNGQFVI